MAALFLVALAWAYMTPWLVAISREHPDQVAIFAVNLLLGWTGFGWIAAMIWATRRADA